MLHMLHPLTITRPLRILITAFHEMTLHCNLLTLIIQVLQLQHLLLMHPHINIGRRTQLTPETHITQILASLPLPLLLHSSCTIPHTIIYLTPVCENCKHTMDTEIQQIPIPRSDHLPTKLHLNLMLVQILQHQTTPLQSLHMPQRRVPCRQTPPRFTRNRLAHCRLL